MPSFAIRGIKRLHLCPVRPQQAGFCHSFWNVKHTGNRSSATTRVPTHAAEQRPLEVEVLPGPSSGAYRYRRTMSQRRAHKPFIIGVAGGTASGKTSVCECTFSVLLLFPATSLGDLPLHADSRSMQCATICALITSLLQAPRS